MPSIHLPEKLEEKAPVAPPIAPQGSPLSDNVYYAIAFLLMVSSLNCVQDTISTKSKELQANAAIQKSILKKITDVVFVKYPNSHPSPATIHKVSMQNKYLASIQQELQEQLVNFRQTAQILMNSGNTAVNAMEQNANSNSSLLSTIHQILTFIMQIGPTKLKFPTQ